MQDEMTLAQAIESGLALKGKITLTHTNGLTGEVTTFEKGNLIVQVGKNFVANALIAASASPFVALAVGSSATAPASGDTALGSELARVAFGSAAAAANVVTVSSTFNPGVGTGAWQEAGLFNNATSGGTMFSHVTFSVVNKGSLDTITVTWQITCG